MILLLLVLQSICALASLTDDAPFDIVDSEETYASKRLADELNDHVCPGENVSFDVRRRRDPNRASVVFWNNGTGESEEGYRLLRVNNDTYAIQRDAASVSGRGSIYGALDILERLGVKFLTSSVTKSAPGCPWKDQNQDPFSMLPEDYTFNTPLEERDVGCYDVETHTDFAIALKCNHGPALPKSSGGGVVYASPPGFVHTSYHQADGNGLVDKDTLWDTHREWFWPRDDKSTYGQLCWTNSSLIDYVIDRVRGFLQDQPDATVVSVSQNDNYLYCNDTNEQKVIAEEGSPMGPLLRAVNQIADAIKDDFPHVAIDTLAYQWSRPAPTITKPRSNVIIRLCSIECNFGEPFDGPSNAKFNEDMTKWSKLSQRIWVWNYVTDFANYVMPWPDYFSIAKNVRYFLEHGVKGIYQEGNYQSYGGDMAELKAYLMSKVMFQPSVNEDDVIEDFLESYFSAPAAPLMRAYLELWHAQINTTGFYLGESVPYTSSFLTPDALLRSAALLNASAHLVDATHLPRIQNAMLPTMYTILLRWNEILAYADQTGRLWPYASRDVAETFDVFASVFNASRATHLNEGGNGLSWLQSQLNISHLA